MKKYIATAVASLCIAGAAAAPGLAAAPGAEVNNPNANANACWGQDRSYYASDRAELLGWDNMDIKQSFPPENGKVGEQKKEWIATYCDPHGPTP